MFLLHFDRTRRRFDQRTALIRRDEAEARKGTGSMYEGKKRRITRSHTHSLGRRTSEESEVIDRLI